MKALEEGTKRLEDGDVAGAKAMYERSVMIKKTASVITPSILRMVRWTINYYLWL